MPEWGWIVVIPAGCVTVAILLVSVLSGRLKLRASAGGKEIEISVADRTHLIAPEAVVKHDPAARERFSILGEELPLIRQVKWSAWLSAVKRAGIAAADIVALDDTQFYGQALGNVIWSGNGIRSYKTILESAIMSREWEACDSDVEFDSFVDGLMRRMSENENRYLDQNYQSRVLEPDGGMRKRVLDRLQVYDLTQSTAPAVRAIVREMFARIRDVEKGRGNETNTAS